MISDHISDDKTSPNEHFESVWLFPFQCTSVLVYLKIFLSQFGVLQAIKSSMSFNENKCDVINDVKLFAMGRVHHGYILLQIS